MIDIQSNNALTTGEEKMSIESLAQDLAGGYEGRTGAIETKKYSTELPIAGDNQNVLISHYENGKKVGEEIQPKRKPYAWEAK